MLIHFFDISELVWGCGGGCSNSNKIAVALLNLSAPRLSSPPRREAKLMFVTGDWRHLFHSGDQKQWSLSRWCECRRPARCALFKQPARIDQQKYFEGDNKGEAEIQFDKPWIHAINPHTPIDRSSLPPPPDVFLLPSPAPLIRLCLPLLTSRCCIRHLSTPSLSVLLHLSIVPFSHTAHVLSLLSRASAVQLPPAPAVLFTSILFNNSVSPPSLDVSAAANQAVTLSFLPAEHFHAHCSHTYKKEDSSSSKKIVISHISLWTRCDEPLNCVALQPSCTTTTSQCLFDCKLNLKPNLSGDSPPLRRA